MRNMTARAAAKAAGERYYDTGAPCKQGHVAKRATLSGSCTQCMAAAAAAWIAARPDKPAGYAAVYRAKDPEGSRARGAAYARKRRAAAPEKHKAYRVAHYAATRLQQGDVVRPKNRTPLEIVLARLQAAHGGLLTYVSGFRNMGALATFRCTVHDKEVASTPHNVLRGANPCARCNHMRSGPEDAMAAYIESLGHIVERHNRKLLGGKEVDIYVPSLRIGFELHGVYWHTDKYQGPRGHRDKWELAQAAGIRLVQIFEDEWLGSEAVVQARIRALLGGAVRYDARKCSLTAISSTEGVAFLNATHSQGSGRASCYYGLYSAGELVAVASFGPSRSGGMTGAKQAGVWEVMRYASTGRVRGGFSRILAQFKRDYAPQSLVSYCDLRFGDGRLYAAAGFTLDSITPPDYWWLPAGGNKRVPRYTSQKHKLAAHPVLGKFFSPEKSEAQICAEAGWEKIHGVGHQKWVWHVATQMQTG